jgi:hypothetical protein
VTEIQNKINTAQHPQRLRNTRLCFRLDTRILTDLPNQKLRKECLPEVLRAQRVVFGFGQVRKDGRHKHTLDGHWQQNAVARPIIIIIIIIIYVAAYTNRGETRKQRDTHISNSQPDVPSHKGKWRVLALSSRTMSTHNIPLLWNIVRVLHVTVISPSPASYTNDGCKFWEFCMTGNIYTSRVFWTSMKKARILLKRRERPWNNTVLRWQLVRLFRKQLLKLSLLSS